MDDTKLLSVTSTKLRQKKKDKDKDKKNRDNNSIENQHNVTLFGGLDDLLNPQLLYHEPLLPSKGIPTHIFAKKKPNLPLRKGVGKLKPDKEIQKILSCYMGGNEGEINQQHQQQQQQYHHHHHHNYLNDNISRSKSNESERRLKHELISLPNNVSETNVSLKLHSLNEAFHGVHQSRINTVLLERTKAIVGVEKYINDMPLQYVFSKSKLKPYAIKRACQRFFSLCEYKKYRYLFLYFHYWKKSPSRQCNYTKLNEKQIGFIVLTKQLDNLIKKQLKRYFSIWSFNFSTKFDSIRSKQYNDSSFLIQDWYRKRKILRKQPFQNLNSVIRMCLYRRKAIYSMIQLEYSRKKALNKIRKGIAQRRRYHYAARTIQRIIRWIFLYRHTKYRLTRQINMRFLHKWIKKSKKRTKTDQLLIHLGFHLGGYSRVKSRIPSRYLLSGRLLESIQMCISTLQRWYLSRKGRLELFMKFAARRSAMEYEAKRNQKATIIQRFYRRHLWNELNRAAILNNRARRIQRGYRSYQYRCWCVAALVRRKKRYQKKIFQFLRKYFWFKLLKKRFYLKNIQMNCEKRRRVCLVRKIQRSYRAHVIYLAIKREQMRIFFATQRLKTDVVLASVRKIQLNFRNSRRPISQLCRHVRLWALGERERQRYGIWKMVYKIQKIARYHIRKQRLADLQMKINAANVIWRLGKSYLLRKALDRLVERTRRRRNAASRRIQHNYRQVVWLRKLKQRFQLMKERIELTKLQNRSAALIQRMIRRKYYEYNTPVRIGARRQLHKKRRQYRTHRMNGLRNYSAKVIQKLFIGLSRWSRFCRLVQKIKHQIRENNSAKKIQKLIKAFLMVSRIAKCIQNRQHRHQLELQRLQQQSAANKIGRFWRRSKELFMLRSLFQLRRKVLDECKRLEEERLQAEMARDNALEEVKITEENMQATINSSWQQGSDATGKNYYYNYVTGESMWEPPPGWTLKIVDQWIRNINERGQVYYYNQLTGESKWLPPCCQCGKDAERWCTDCCLSYCVEDFKLIHDKREGQGQGDGGEGQGQGQGDDGNNGMSEHVWAVAELEKEVLKPGQVYCIECKKRVCTRVCLTCWDYYCDPCFKFVHHIGDLKLHETISYARAKKGWIAIKPKEKGEKIYYLNGVSGETTYDKPVELMTETEKINYENFIIHRDAATKHVKTIEKLQFELEGLKYERDLKLAKEAPDLLAQKNQKKSNETDDVMRNIQKKQGGFSFFSSLNSGYVAKLMKPDPRRRGEKRSNYIQSLLDDKDMT